jgi:simple sugar transport system ATP-binding protein
VIELRGIHKYFSSNGVYALDNVDFDLHPGEIHALLGENGAGKSTLMHIMAGYLKPGAGHILADRKEERFSSPGQALAAGIGMVRQHPQLTPGFTVWEDCILGAEPCFAGLVKRKKARDQVRSLSERWGFDLPIDRPTGGLTVGQRQKAAILALLLRNTRYLIFDEVTAVLSPQETQGFFSLLHKLKEEGKGIVLISHKLEETLGIADRVSVLKKGRIAAPRLSAALDPEKLSGLMFNIQGPNTSEDDLSEKPAPGKSDPVESDPVEFASVEPASVKSDPARRDSPALSIQNLSVELKGRPFIRNVNLELFPGTILGIAGVRDSGPETLELAVTGFLRPSAGRIILLGRDITGRGPRAFREAGAAYLSADKTGRAFAAELPLRDSIIIHAHRRSPRGLWKKLGLMDRRFLDSRIAGVMQAAQVRGSPAARADSFSGGMLQRVILAREFAEEASLLVLAEPGWGLDRSGRDRFFRELKARTRTGMAALVFSSDVDELVSVSDEILVLRNGVVAASVSRPASSPGAAGDLKERISRAMVGIAGDVSAGGASGKEASAGGASAREAGHV